VQPARGRDATSPWTFDLVIAEERRSPYDRCSMASKPLSVFKEPGRRRHRQFRHGLYGFAPFLVAALGIVGLVAVVLLVLGLLDVHAVTRHFSVH
jgi:hypothetical protein